MENTNLTIEQGLVTGVLILLLGVTIGLLFAGYPIHALGVIIVFKVLLFGYGMARNV